MDLLCCFTAVHSYYQVSVGLIHIQFFGVEILLCVMWIIDISVHGSSVVLLQRSTVSYYRVSVGLIHIQFFCVEILLYVTAVFDFSVDSIAEPSSTTKTPK